MTLFIGETNYANLVEHRIERFELIVNIALNLLLDFVERGRLGMNIVHPQLVINLLPHPALIGTTAAQAVRFSF